MPEFTGYTVGSYVQFSIYYQAGTNTHIHIHIGEVITVIPVIAAAAVPVPILAEGNHIGILLDINTVPAFLLQNFLKGQIAQHGDIGRAEDNAVLRIHTPGHSHSDAQQFFLFYS